MDLSRLSHDVVRSLPVEVLGLELLRALTAGGGPDLMQNRDNVRINLETHVWSDDSREDRHAAGRGYEEAFSWLERSGLVAQEPGQGQGWFYVTKRGRSVLSDPKGLAKMRAEDRLDLELHPLIAGSVRAQFLLGEYELAALRALREVEIRVRNLSGASQSDIGGTQAGICNCVC